MASALFNTMRNLGGAIGIASINTWLNSGTNLHWLRLNESLSVGRPELNVWLTRVTSHMQGAIADPVTATDRAVGILAQLTRRESATMAFSDALLMMSVLFFAAMLLVPLIRRPAKPVQASTENH
jgi:MFS transporter, DHA2 family, multidrug resistance protein